MRLVVGTVLLSLVACSSTSSSRIDSDLTEPSGAQGASFGQFETPGLYSRPYGGGVLINRRTVLTSARTAERVRTQGSDVWPQVDYALFLARVDGLTVGEAKVARTVTFPGSDPSEACREASPPSAPDIGLVLLESEIEGSSPLPLAPHMPNGEDCMSPEPHYTFDHLMFDTPVAKRVGHFVSNGSVQLESGKARACDLYAKMIYAIDSCEGRRAHTALNETYGWSTVIDGNIVAWVEQTMESWRAK